MKRLEYQMLNKVGKIFLYDVIGYEDNSAAAFAKVVQEMQNKGIEKFEIHLNSPGGFLTDGLAIYNLMKELNADVYIDGLAASAASLIAMGGKKIYMHESSMFMIHNPTINAHGDHRDMEKAAEVSEQFRNTALSAYMAKTKRPEAEIIAWMDEEKWFNAADARAAGFVDEIIKNSTNFLGENTMKEFFVKLLGLKKDAGDDEIKAAAEALKMAADQVPNLTSRIEQLEEMLTSPEGKEKGKSKKEKGELEAKVEALEANLEKATGVITALETELKSAKAEQVLSEAVNSGKILPAQKEDYREKAMKDPAAFKAEMDKREKIWDPAKGLKMEDGKEAPKNEIQAAAEYIRANRN